MSTEGSHPDKKVKGTAEGGNSKAPVTQEEPAGKSKWQKIIEKEKKQADERKKQQDEARAKRLAHLFKDEESEDEDMMAKHLDFGAA